MILSLAFSDGGMSGPTTGTPNGRQTRSELFRHGGGTHPAHRPAHIGHPAHLPAHRDVPHQDLPARGSGVSSELPAHHSVVQRELDPAHQSGVAVRELGAHYSAAHHLFPNVFSKMLARRSTDIFNHQASHGELSELKKGEEMRAK